MFVTGATKAIGSLEPLHDALCLTHALKLIVRNMGNGVDRLLHASVITLAEARIEAALDGREPMCFPYPERFFEMGGAALVLLGIAPSMACSTVCEACVRMLDDNTVEIVSWLRS
jgi:hypothetical protein